MEEYIKRLLFVVIVTITYNCSSYSQGINYRLISSEQISPSLVRLSIIVYGKSKKTVDIDAQCSALQVAMFDGCPNTSYSKPLIDDGAKTSYNNHPQFFENLYSDRYSDFIMSCEAISAFKKGDKKKGTEYSIVVKILTLRKDLEKNGIKRKIGL